MEFVIKKRFGDTYVENRFLKVLVDFYKNYSQREIIIEDYIDDKIVYQGKDNAKFNNALLDNKIDQLYINIMNEMEKGFNSVVVANEKEMKKMYDILRFLCIEPFVNIKIKEKEC